MDLIEYCSIKLDELNSKHVICEREHIENLRDSSRVQFQRDYCRVLYSNAFRRLQGKMQLFGYSNKRFIRNRLTHSLEVCQIAEAIASKCKYDESDKFVVKASALAHDIGNPPFGHFGENVLNEIMKNDGGFEGNAQSLRIIHSIDVKNPTFKGLNLTNRTLLSILKYNRKYDNGTNKKFIYDDDYEYVNNLILANNIRHRTLDVQIVDLADEIAYAAHDMEDGLNNNIFSIDDLIQELNKNNLDSNEMSDFNDLVNNAKDFSLSGTKNNTGKEVKSYFTKELLSLLINMLINDIDIIEIADKKIKETGALDNKEIGLKNYGKLVFGLKKAVFNCANYSDSVYIYEKNGEAVIKTLFEYFNDNIKCLPVEYREEENPKYKKRRICDYIAGMMDSFAIDTYESITGDKFERAGYHYNNKILS